MRSGRRIWSCRSTWQKHGCACWVLHSIWPVGRILSVAVGLSRARLESFESAAVASSKAITRGQSENKRIGTPMLRDLQPSLLQAVPLHLPLPSVSRSDLASSTSTHADDRAKESPHAGALSALHRSPGVGAEVSCRDGRPCRRKRRIPAVRSCGCSV